MAKVMKNVTNCTILFDYSNSKNILKKKKISREKQKNWVSLCCLGYQPLPIHGRNPITAPHGDFCLLRFRPGPVRPSLVDLDVLASAEPTISMPSLMRTPDLHRVTTNRTPKLKRSTNSGFQVAGLQTHATTPSRYLAGENSYMNLKHVLRNTKRVYALMYNPDH